MGLFKTKADKELEKKLLIKRTVNAMNKQIAKLEAEKQAFLEKAKTAKKNGLEAQFNLALTGYKMTLAQQKRAQEMLLNFEITSQMKDMTMMTGEFLSGMSVLSKEMSQLVDGTDFVNIQKEFERAMGKVQLQTEKMEVFMEMSQDTFGSTVKDGGSEDDAEIRSLIDESIGQESSDTDIDRELAELHKKLSE